MSRRASWRRISSSGLPISAGGCAATFGASLTVWRRGDRHRRLGTASSVPLQSVIAPRRAGCEQVGLLLGGRGLLERARLDDAEPGGAGSADDEQAQEDREEQPDPALDQLHQMVGRMVSAASRLRIVDAGRCTSKGNSASGTGRFDGCRSGAARRRREVVVTIRSAIWPFGAVVAPVSVPVAAGRASPASRSGRWAGVTVGTGRDGGGRGRGRGDGRVRRRRRDRARRELGQGLAAVGHHLLGVVAGLRCAPRPGPGRGQGARSGSPRRRPAGSHPLVGGRGLDALARGELRDLGLEIRVDALERGES